MSNEKHETIEDIVADIRAQNQGLPEDSYALSPLVCDLLSFADRIEAAVNQPVTNCNHLGDAAKMREALVKADAAFRRISRSAWFIDANFSETKEVMDAGDAVASALSATPRNCDRFSNANEALEAFEKETGETMIEFIRWLFAEEKGTTK